MDRFEINKIIAAIVLTVVIVVGINKIADMVYNVKVPKATVYKVAAKAKDSNKESTEKTNNEVDIKDLLVLGDVQHGKKVFKQCAACHSISKNGGNKIGPALWGVIGRKTAAISDYRYSKGLNGLNKTWNFETMNVFLIKPKDYVKGTKMAYAGLKKKKDRASVILYLNEQSDAPLPLP